jgi:hypothetical protein
VRFSTHPERSEPVSTKPNNSRRQFVARVFVVATGLLSMSLLMGSGFAVAAGTLFQDDLVIENAQVVYFPGERVDLRYSGCAPLSMTRLELQSARRAGLAVAVYPSPLANVAGSVRTSVMLPADLATGDSFLLLSCARADGQLVQAAAVLPIDQPTAAARQARQVLYVPVVVPSPQDESGEDLAVTGVSVLPVAVASIFALVLTAGVLVITRRRGGPQWSPAGMPMNGPR